jgi:O-antigen ligase
LTETTVVAEEPLAGPSFSESRGLDERLARFILLVAPGALIVYMGFNAGGYFPGTPAIGALIMAALLLLRLFLAEEPLEGFTRTSVAAIAMLVIYTVVALLSATWSHSTSRALLAYDRDLVYLLTFTLYATLRPSPADIRWMLRWIMLGIAVVCLAGLISRVLPNIWHTAPGIANQRLSYPITYWNALGILTTLGIILGVYMSSSAEEPWPIRIAGAALVPLLCATLYFTFSRGSMAAAAVGVIVYALVARPRLLPGALVAVVPVAAVVVYVAYHANLLATPDPTTPAAIKQAHHVALALGLGILVSAALRFACAHWLDPGLQRRGIADRIERRRRITLLSATGALALVLILVFSVPSSVAHDWNQFLHSSSSPTAGGDLRTRLTSFSSNGRIALWRTAIQAFDAKPLNGEGAGTYQLLWDRSEPVYEQNVNAHGLYFETMAEMGLLGLVPLVLFIGAVLVGLFRRARGPERVVYAAIGSATLAYFLHAGVDWDWQMPVIGIGIFAASGFALRPTLGGSRWWNPRPNTRMLLAVGCLATAVLPLMIIASQSRLHSAEVDLRASKCEAATRAALSEIGWLPSRPEAYEIFGYCDLERGFAKLGVQAMQEAINHDPGNWEPRYSLALADAADGVNPRAAAAQALLMNPKDPLAQDAVQAFAHSGPGRWPSTATRLRTQALDSGQLSISPT